MKIAFVTVPLMQPNTPYPAMPMLSGWFRKLGRDVRQYDFCIEAMLKMLSPATLEAAAAGARKAKPDDLRDYFLDSLEDYKRTLPQVLAFLQGKKPELAWRIAARSFLPEGPFFAELDPEQRGSEGEQENLDYGFGVASTVDKAKYLASLYLDDVSSFITQFLDEDFKLGKYCEGTAVSLASFEPMYRKLNDRARGYWNGVLDDLTQAMLEDYAPDVVCISVPFPGTLYSALHIGRYVKQHSQARVLLGGGYVNSELREVEDKRLYEFIDALSYDEGFQPLFHEIFPEEDIPAAPAVLLPDYTDLDLSAYFSMMEVPNRMMSLWTDGKWAKMQIARGCYWHKCAFCDVALDYICRYQAASAREIVDAMVEVEEKSGLSGFHFVDEAIAPSVLRKVCEEIIARGLAFTWWGNIRFDNGFSDELVQLMADAGCIAVTGGLECAHDRLLKLMNKGITCEGAAAVMRRFRDAGIMVHAYLMYGFPTETAAEAQSAMEFVQACFEEGCLQSAHWHRFALTAHSAIAKSPQDYGIRLLPEPCKGPRFARNEIPYVEAKAPDWNKIGKRLIRDTYNLMLN